MTIVTKGNSGFTIVELLIVVVVIAILAAISIISYTGITNRASESSVNTDVVQLGKQVELFRAVNGRYPTVPLNLAAGPAPELEDILRKGRGVQPNSFAAKLNWSRIPTNAYEIVHFLRLTRRNAVCSCIVGTNC